MDVLFTVGLYPLSANTCQLWVHLLVLFDLIISQMLCSLALHWALGWLWLESCSP